MSTDMKINWEFFGAITPKQAYLTFSSENINKSSFLYKSK